MRREVILPKADAASSSIVHATMADFKGHTLEAARARIVAKKREQQLEEMKMKMEQMERESNRSAADISSKFAARSDNIEEKLKVSTYGLVTLEQMKAHREAVEAERIRLLAQGKAQAEEKAALKKAKAKKIVGSLSFDLEADADEDGDEGDTPLPKRKVSEDNNKEADTETGDGNKSAVTFKKKKIGKDPEVDTSFLPDRDRQEAEQRERERILKEIKEKREQAKAEKIVIVFSYWDGTGHAAQLQMAKGSTISEFLLSVLQALRNQFIELRGVTTESLMYVKDDLIIPHHYSFFDFIATKARGRSGPLFQFDDDVRSNKIADESQTGRVRESSFDDKG
jgi:protein FAM50